MKVKIDFDFLFTVQMWKIIKKSIFFLFNKTKLRKFICPSMRLIILFFQYIQAYLYIYFPLMTAFNPRAFYFLDLFFKGFSCPLLVLKKKLLIKISLILYIIIQILISCTKIIKISKRHLDRSYKYTGVFA